MIPTEILPDFSSDDLTEVAQWLDRLPVHVFHTARMARAAFCLSDCLSELADLRRKG